MARAQKDRTGSGGYQEGYAMRGERVSNPSSVTVFLGKPLRHEGKECDQERGPGLKDQAGTGPAHPLYTGTTENLI